MSVHCERFVHLQPTIGSLWADVNFTAQFIRIRRSWTGGKIGRPKNASSRATVPCGPILSHYLKNWRVTSPYSQDGDWVFPSFRNKGKTPRVANMLCSDHLRPAAIAAGVLKGDQDVRFGFQTMRHSLASFLVGRGENPTVVQKLLRHSDVTTTLGLYSHAPNQDRLTAKADMMAAFFESIFVQQNEGGERRGAGGFSPVTQIYL